MKGITILSRMIRKHKEGFPSKDVLEKWIAHIKEGDREWHGVHDDVMGKGEVYLKEIPTKRKPESCYVCDGDTLWICSTYEGKILKHAYEVGMCIKCGIIIHSLFGCQNNTCEWHENCHVCGSELCIDINDGDCYRCEGKASSQEDANIAYDMFGDDSSR
jgi:hypothetical protein